MNIGESEIKKALIALLLLGTVLFSILVISPIIQPIIIGLVVAYLFNPLYKKINSKLNNRTLTASLVLIMALVIIIVPLWFIMPILIQETFNFFRTIQSVHTGSLIDTLFPTGADQFKSQLVVSLDAIISNLSSSILKSLVSVFLELPTILLGVFIAAFVFFFALRDSDRLVSFVSGISPINKSKEKIITQQFKGITESIIYGQFAIGLMQGLLLGLGLLIFGVDNALILTIIAIFLSLIPMLGPYLIWIPISFYLFTTSGFWIAALYFLYNLVIVSLLDNVLRSYIVSRRVDISPAVVIIGIFGGLAMFGIIGILLGPLILAYLVTFLRSYKDKNLYSLFSEEEEKKD